MSFILKYAKVLVLVIAAAAVSYASPNDVKTAAKVGSDNISLFEVKSFVNTVVPVGKFHAGSLDKKKYWDDALNKAVDARLLRVYLKENKPEVFEKVKDKADKIIETIRQRFNSEGGFEKALKSNGISKEILRDTHIDMNVKSVFKNYYMKNLQIEDKKLEDYYNNNKGMFMLGESVMVKNCLIEADARNLDKDQMKQKKDKVEMVLQLMKNGREKRGFQMCDNGTFPLKQRVYKFTKGYPVGKILSLNKGEFGGPYENIYGYLVVKAVKRFNNEPVPYEEVKSNIRQIMEKSKFKERYNAIMKRMKNEVSVKKIMLNSTDS
ncbi:hypothetical protein Flexsi_1994 [Flexistipes sinusarabici DSM 4947]|uniref:PpiC domain-containing protein n=1 Tax=Flexistipes sinusarabici (strain ATCC 49648 / DSM 4947 / MAS 10) TaxID=717231 RepID=F8E4R5_FLESM|nr:peptidyl-prolyl cis-trans isomerase [Flexistipes sinusarabici]AEI15623.1 hypothetical protein Flexsi_1994 [Flexistipes sinusarabici DSM 4947]